MKFKILTAFLGLATSLSLATAANGSPPVEAWVRWMDSSRCDDKAGPKVVGTVTLFKNEGRLFALTSYGAILDDRREASNKFCVLLTPGGYKAKVIWAQWSVDLALLSVDADIAKLEEKAMKPVPEWKDIVRERYLGGPHWVEVRGSIYKDLAVISPVLIRWDSDRNFLSSENGQVGTIELGNSEYACSTLMGAPAYEPTRIGPKYKPIYGIWSRQYLLEKSNYSVRIRDWINTPPEHPKGAVPILIPFRTIRAWLTQAFKTDTTQVRLDDGPYISAEDRLSNKSRVRVGGPNPAMYELVCPKASSPSTDNGAIGGTDLAGIGGTDLAGIGGSEPIAIGGAAGATACVIQASSDLTQARGADLANYPHLMKLQKALEAKSGTVSFVSHRDATSGQLYAEGFGTLDEFIFRSEMQDRTPNLILRDAEETLLSLLLSDVQNRAELLSRQTLPESTNDLVFEVLTLAAIEASTTPELATARDWAELVDLEGPYNDAWTKIREIEMTLASPKSLHDQLLKVIAARSKP